LSILHEGRFKPENNGFNFPQAQLPCDQLPASSSSAGDQGTGEVAAVFLWAVTPTLSANYMK
jgi:hypothetical protein